MNEKKQENKHENMIKLENFKPYMNAIEIATD